MYLVCVCVFGFLFHSFSAIPKTSFSPSLSQHRQACFLSLSLSLSLSLNKAAIDQDTIHPEHQYIVSASDHEIESGQHTREWKALH